jgi:hypothetical protein
MPLLERFDPPALVADFDRLPDVNQLREKQREGWSRWMDDVFNNAIRRVKRQLGGAGTPQFFNPKQTDPGAVLEEDITWNAFPRVLLRLFSRTAALSAADELEPSPLGASWLSRNQDEYCEWRVTRDPDTGKITRVTFTCEGPEYWQSIAGGRSIYGDNVQTPATFGAPGDRATLVTLYRELLGNDDVQEEDLFLPNAPDIYNPWNKWNTTDGIVHLQQQNNTLTAEIYIGADASIARQKGGQTLTDATQLICCGGYGGAERWSDPRIGDRVNRHIRNGRAVSLRNPVGIYMADFKDTEITRPNPAGAQHPRLAASGYWNFVRGTPPRADVENSGLVLRAVFEVPQGVVGADGHQLTVSDLMINNQPIQFGGQLAELITMKFVALATQATTFQPTPRDCRAKCCRQGKVIDVVGLNDPCRDVFPGGPTPFLDMESVDPTTLSIPLRRGPIDDE